jgi:hypothetical protein
MDLGQFFTAADGKATFIGRNTIVPISMTVYQSDFLKDIPQPQPWDTICKKANVIAHPLVLASTGYLWQLYEVPLVLPGQTVEYWTNFSYNGFPCAGMNVTAPVATTDYLMNSQADGLGTNLTANFTVTMTAFSKTTKLRVTNIGGSGGYILALKQPGQALYSPAATTMTSGTGDRVFELDNEWMQKTDTAASYAEYLADKMGSALSFPTVKMEGRPDIQFSLDLFDAVQANLTKLRINENMSIGKITHHWLSENGQAVKTTWKLEPFAGFSGGWLFDVHLGVDSAFVL